MPYILQQRGKGENGTDLKSQCRKPVFFLPCTNLRSDQELHKSDEKSKKTKGKGATLACVQGLIVKSTMQKARTWRCRPA
jgi:hypothetical protein